MIKNKAKPVKKKIGRLPKVKARLATKEPPPSSLPLNSLSPSLPTTTKFAIIKRTSKWDEAYPYIEETIKTDREVFTVAKYHSALDVSPPELEKFLFDTLRVSTIPNFVKSNFKKIKKLIEKEVQHRNKMHEKLSREQKSAFTSYFHDNEYFTRSMDNEYFEHELAKVYVSYLKTYCETAIYESRVRLGNKKRRDILSKYNIVELNG